MGFAVILGEAIASPDIPPRAAFFGFITGFLLLGACTIQDLDIRSSWFGGKELDHGGYLVNPNEAISVAIVLASLGLLSAAYLGSLALLTALLCTAVIIAYHARMKKIELAKDAFAGSFVALMLVFAGFAVGGPTLLLLICSILALFSSTGRSIMKNMFETMTNLPRQAESDQDPTGNRASGAGKQSAACFLAAVGTSALPVLRGLVSIYYIPLAVICDVGFLLTAYSLSSSPTFHSARRSEKYVLLWMSFGLLAFLIGTI